MSAAGAKKLFVLKDKCVKMVATRFLRIVIMITKGNEKDFLAPLESIPPKSFETKRLKLRAVEPGDSKLIFDLYASDPIATRYMSFKCTGQLEDTASYIEPVAQNFLGHFNSIKHFDWVIQIKETLEPLGVTGFGSKNTFSLVGGYILAQKWWGRGYASEAWKCLIDWVRSETGVFRVEAEHHPDNPASGRVMTKAGMRLEGILRRYAMFPNLGGEPQDVVMYSWTR